MYPPTNDTYVTDPVPQSLKKQLGLTSLMGWGLGSNVGTPFCGLYLGSYKSAGGKLPCQEPASHWAHLRRGRPAQVPATSTLILNPINPKSGTMVTTLNKYCRSLSGVVGYIILDVINKEPPKKVWVLSKTPVLS